MLDSVNCKLRYTHDGSDHSLGTHFSDLGVVSQQVVQ